MELLAGSSLSGCQGGPATSAQFSFPCGLAYHASTDTLFVADSGNHAVRAIGTAPAARHSLPTAEASGSDDLRNGSGAGAGIPAVVTRAPAGASAMAEAANGDSGNDCDIDLSATAPDQVIAAVRGAMATCIEDAAALLSTPPGQPEGHSDNTSPRNRPGTRQRMHTW